MSKRARGALRQLRFPKAFRIAPPVWDDQWLGVLEKLAEAPGILASSEISESSVASAAPPEHLRLFAGVGTGLWRVRQVMIDPQTGRPREEMRRAYRHVESIWDALVEAGIQIQDHTGMLFDSGMSLRVIEFQPTAGLGREQVLDTIKPSVYYDGQLIQMGEVIVGTPQAHSAAAT